MRLLLLVLGLISVVKTEAKCSSEQLTISPGRTELHENTCLLFEGYGTTQQFIETLSLDSDAFLTAENGEKIKLNAIAYNPGQFRINQAILQPEQSLTPGIKYTLNFENLDQAAHVPYELAPGEPLPTWTVKAATINQHVKLFTPPKLIRSQAELYGCGPTVSAEFEFITNSDTPVLVKTELMDLTDQTTHTYFLHTSAKDTLSIGHGMCSGAFRYNPKHHYQVRFSIMDSCNAQTNDWTDWIVFENPFRSLD